jgi:predicted PurR-regulated permease PerM
VNQKAESPFDPSGRAAWAVLMVALIAGVVIVLRVLAPFFAVILLAVVAAGLLYPVYRWMVATFHGHRRTAAVCLCVLLLLAVVGPIFVTAQVVSKEALNFYELTTTQLAQRSLMEELVERQEKLDRVNRYLQLVGMELTVDDVVEGLTGFGVRLGGFFYRQGVNLAKGLVRLVLGFFFWVLILYYLLLDGPRLKQWFADALPLPAEQQSKLSRRFMEMASSLVVGNGLAGIIQGAAGGVIFAMLGLPGPVLWGVVMAILAFIPVIGISLVYVPVAVVLLLAGETTKALAVLIPLMVVATVVEYWLKPILVGRRAQMHTVLVFLSLLGGLDAFGPVGLLMGPLMMTAFLTLVSIFREQYRPQLQKRPGSTAALEEVPAGPTTAVDDG